MNTNARDLIESAVRTAKMALLQSEKAQRQYEEWAKDAARTVEWWTAQIEEWERKLKEAK